MENTLSWQEICKKYPKQWVSLADVEYDTEGKINLARVVDASPDLKIVTASLKGKEYKSHSFRFTGEVSNFLGFSKWSIEDVKIYP